MNQVALKLPERVIAKIFLFRTIFRGSGYAFSVDPQFMHVSADRAYWDQRNEDFYAKYKGLDQKHKEWADMVVRGRPIVGPLGREWLVDMRVDRNNDYVIPWTVLSNYPVQGTGADLMLLARISLSRRLQATDWPVQLVSTVHDSIVGDMPKEYAQRFCNLCHQVFDDLIPNIKRIFNYDWVVPLGCEVKMGMNMRDMEKLQRDDK